MIRRLNHKDVLNLLHFVNTVDDTYQDFYVTIDRQRKFFKNDLVLIKKILETQKCYGWFDMEMKGCIIILREKGFRPYLKILASQRQIAIDLIKYLNWNCNLELFSKLKNSNPLVIELKKNRFFIEGLRGKEILLKKMKEVREIKNVNNTNN